MIYYILILLSDIFKNIPSFFLQNSVYIFSSILIAKSYKTKSNNLISTVIFFLLITYLISLLISLFFSKTSFIFIIQHFLYVAIPLLLFYFLLNRNLKIQKISSINNGLIISFIFVAIVGFIQNFIDPGFLANRFSEITGSGSGQVFRAIAGLNQKFLKISSIFASADKYSAVSQSIFLISIFNLRIAQLENWKKNRKYICYMGIISSIFSLIIAGARARIITLFIALVLVFSFLTIRSFISKKDYKIPKSLKKFFLLISSLFIGITIFIPNFFNNLYESFGIFKLFASTDNYINLISRFIGQTGIRQEVLNNKGWVISRYDSELKTFSQKIIGDGLGSISFGKPGEAGVISTLSESGYILGILILGILIFIAIMIFIFGIKKINLKNITFIFILNLIAVDLLLSSVVGLIYFFEPCHLIILYPSVIGCINIIQLSSNERNLNQQKFLIN